MNNCRQEATIGRSLRRLLMTLSCRRFVQRGIEQLVIWKRDERLAPRKRSLPFCGMGCAHRKWHFIMDVKSQ
jgi:hypothetical protein